MFFVFFNPSPLAATHASLPPSSSLPLRITAAATNDLKVEMLDADGLYGEALYRGFFVDTGANSYQMYVSGYASLDNVNVPEAGDALRAGDGEYASPGVPLIAESSDSASICQFANNPGW